MLADETVELKEDAGVLRLRDIQKNSCGAGFGDR